MTLQFATVCRRGSWVGDRFAPQERMHGKERVYTEDSEETEITEEREES
jgi:hypothetical protein